MFPLFTGSSGIIRGDLLLEYKFADGIFNNYQSVTEDWALSIRLQRDGYLVIATHQLETWGRPPEDNKAYKKQQYRWAYGTTRDIKHHLRAVLRNKNLTLTEKLGFLAQQSHYLGGILAPLGYLGQVVAYHILGLPDIIAPLSLSIFVYLTLGTFYPDAKWCPIRSILYRWIVMLPVYSRAVLNSLLKHEVDWAVTRRKRS